MESPSDKSAVTRRLPLPRAHLLIFCAVSLILLVGGIALAANSLIAGFKQIETAAVGQKAQQVYRAFEGDLRQLAVSNRDYAEWDDAEQFIHSHDPRFLHGNFSPNQLSGLSVNLVWIVDASGTELYSGLLDGASREVLSPAPPALLRQFAPFLTVERRLRELSPADRVLQTTRGLAAVSAIEVARSDLTHATGAIMLFARFVGDDVAQRMRKTTQLPLSIRYLDEQRRGPLDLPSPVQGWIASAPPRPATFVFAPSDQSIVGYTLVQDPQRRPIAVLSTQAARDIYALGHRITWRLLNIILALFVIFGTAAAVMLYRLRRSFAAQLSMVEHGITQRREAEELQQTNRRRLTQLAHHDPLTGLPNRLFLQKRLPRVLKRAGISERLLCVIYLDIDQFKNINDSLGHGCGDQLLQVIARRLRASVSEADVVARMGGDEFVIVLALMPNAEAIEQVVARLHAAVQAPVTVNGSPLSVSASMGIAVYPHDGLDMDALLKYADIALYQAKEAGRRCHRFFTADMDVRVSEQVALEQALRHAVGSEQFYLDYQPIVDVRSGYLASMEALMRWRHPELGLIPPSQFIPVAESSGLIEMIGEFAIREVLAQLQRWVLEDVPVVPVAVNVATVQLEREDFAPMVARMATDAGVDMCLLRFEITESAVVKNAERLIGTLRSLRELGVQILVDDFGTGYSNLSHLARLPVDTLKIDRAFVQKMETDIASASIVRSVISMAKELKLSTTAEGVETPGQFHMLSELGCDYAQGYYYSRPVPARQCKQLLEFLQQERAFSEAPPRRRHSHSAQSM